MGSYYTRQKLIIHDKIAFTQHRSMKDQIDQLQGICDLQMYSGCPACPKVLEAGNLPFRFNCSFKYRVKVVHSQLLLMQISDYAESDLQAKVFMTLKRRI